MNPLYLGIGIGSAVALAISAVLWLWVAPRMGQEFAAQIATLNSSNAALNAENETKTATITDSNQRIKMLVNQNAALKRRALKHDIGTPVTWRKDGKTHTGVIFDHVRYGEQYEVPMQINGKRVNPIGKLSIEKEMPTYIILIEDDDVASLRRPAPSLVKEVI